MPPDTDNKASVHIYPIFGQHLSDMSEFPPISRQQRRGHASGSAPTIFHFLPVHIVRHGTSSTKKEHKIIRLYCRRLQMSREKILPNALDTPSHPFYDVSHMKADKSWDIVWGVLVQFTLISYLSLAISFRFPHNKNRTVFSKAYSESDPLFSRVHLKNILQPL